ncbi:hypothetical protein B0J17DRAFT_136836 [Rhizoctonia solani]|nr:hypothetical protein B0J17DRAFT_136836 [Rhizoctonia solani]
MSTYSACMDSSSTQWMFNSVGQSPCEVLDQLVKVCETSASVPNLSVDVSCASLGTNSSSACCCSTATFASVIEYVPDVVVRVSSQFEIEWEVSLFNITP